MSSQEGPVRRLGSAMKYGLFLVASAWLAQASLALGQAVSHSSGFGSAKVITAPHFFAAHGRGGMIDGTSDGGLEVWIYPFQILRDYRVGFHHVGESREILGSTVLSRIEYDADRIIRVYAGADFLVRESLIVPEQGQGGVICYQVESGAPLQIVVHATPVLDLMWPGAIGGQGAGWNETMMGYVLSEPLHGYSAVVKAPGTVAHDPIVNQEMSPGGQQIGFTIEPDRDGKATVFVALNPPNSDSVGKNVDGLIKNFPGEETAAATRLAAFRKNTLLLKTPDQDLNWAFDRAETALDQAWVCNTDIGCGFVAGYGPTRPGRRPQYDWFFAGDGMIAGDGALAIGDLARARDELKFVIQRQNKTSGMIWHELSQSAGLIDWANKYPYMFVHVDITFQFLTAVQHYVRTSGDVEFLREHWSSIESAYKYCRGLVDPATGLPQIPAEKEGGNEQEKLSDDLGLSASWVKAAAAVADLAVLTGNKRLAEEASGSERAAHKSISERYWSEREAFWISGHNQAGQPIFEHRSGPTEALTLDLFGSTRTSKVLDQLASAAFETDWGTRSVGEGSAGYEPDSYASGSVWPVNTASLSEAFWAEHRPVTAFSLWQTLIPLSSQDSLGHIHEVFSGVSYHPQAESVPEQTWSSAGFASATVHGLLGLEIDGIKDTMTFSPRTPAEWSDVEIEHIRLPKQLVALKLHRSTQQIQLKIENSGLPFQLEFRPDLPLGSKLVKVSFGRQQVRGDAEQLPGDTIAQISVRVPSGQSTLDLSYSEGVSVVVDPVRPAVGDESSGVHVIRAELQGERLVIDADVPSGQESEIWLVSPWSFYVAGGATLEHAGTDREILRFPVQNADGSHYRRAHVEINVSR